MTSTSEIELPLITESLHRRDEEVTGDTATDATADTATDASWDTASENVRDTATGATEVLATKAAGDVAIGANEDATEAVTVCQCPYIAIRKSF